jgi:FMNH2-dependent dimethyl sulfone monooxygenase
MDRENRPNCPLFGGGHKLKLGLFGTNCSYRLCVSTAPTNYRATWEQTLTIVLDA